MRLCYPASERSRTPFVARGICFGVWSSPLHRVLGQVLLWKECCCCCCINILFPQATPTWVNYPNSVAAHQMLLLLLSDVQRSLVPIGVNIWRMRVNFTTQAASVAHPTILSASGPNPQGSHLTRPSWSCLPFWLWSFCCQGHPTPNLQQLQAQQFSQHCISSGYSFLAFEFGR